jgi:hypothetical protein
VLLHRGGGAVVRFRLWVPMMRAAVYAAVVAAVCAAAVAVVVPAVYSVIGARRYLRVEWSS